jgi:hypothetical protein
MMSSAWRLALRGIAITIAILAAIDPSVTSMRPAKPIVAVVAAQPSDSSLANRVAGSLGKQFTVVRAPFPDANAMVIAGDHLPTNVAAIGHPVFAVLDDRTRASVSAESIDGPANAPLSSRVRVPATLHVTGARGRTLDVSLRANEMVVDHVTRAVRSDDERVSVPLTFVPTSPGTASLRVHASLGGADSAVADLGVDVRDRRWAVLVYDPRPSWMSTFVRRALERDPRLVVTSRVVTSRNVSTDVGQPPARLDELVSLGAFDAMVIGAPEALADRDVAGVDAFLRRRGGSVVLLLDRRAAGPYERLVGATTWASDSTGKAESIIAASDSMKAAELVWPTTLPGATDVVASTRGAAAHPIVWSSHVGAGRVIVSGALDAWRYRDPSVSSFDTFWQNVVADAAAASPLPVAVTASRTVAAPGERVGVTAVVRDAALSPARPMRASAVATVGGDLPEAPLRMWPGDRVGTFRGVARAPAIAGVYRFAVAANGARGDATLIVERDATRPSRGMPDLVRAWVASRGGTAILASDLASLAPRLSGAIHKTDRRMTWHPMRSAWWILPFALALSLEWWLRRRRGLL